MLAAAKERSTFIPSLAASAFARLSENPHRGFRLPTAALHPSQAIANSNTASGLQAYSYDFGRRSRSTGKERDNESGLDFFGARYFSGAMGRFTTPDWSAAPTPVPYADPHDPQSLNLYAYVRNNPLSRTDPDGHWCLFGFGTTCTPNPAPPPPPPAPTTPAVITPGTPQNALANAQDAARNNPAFAPSGTRGTPGRTTHCNQATCRIAQDTGTSTNGLVDQNGNPNLANTDARTLANSPSWRPVTPEEAQNLADKGVTVVGVVAENPHGHIVTVRPELEPGVQTALGQGPLINNIGGSVGIANANSVFRRDDPTYYAPTNQK